MKKIFSYLLLFFFVTSVSAQQAAIATAHPLATAAGEPRRWPDEMARGLKRALGSPEFSWSSFQTLWDDLLAQGTDFLD